MKHSHGDSVANILSYARTASPSQRQAGMDWYGEARRIVELIAEATGTDPYRVCHALAALSPRNPWRWNVADAYSFAVAAAEGRTMPKATTFGRNQLAAWQALREPGQPWLSAAPKVRAFVAAIMGDSEAVVVDVWAYRAATGKSPKTMTAKQYAAIARAYRQAAEQLGVSPRELQAIVWLVVQTEGLASHRRGRHDRSIKRGTPSLIVEALTGQQALGL